MAARRRTKRNNETKQRKMNLNFKRWKIEQTCSGKWNRHLANWRQKKNSWRRLLFPRTGPSVTCVCWQGTKWIALDCGRQHSKNPWEFPLQSASLAKIYVAP